MTRRASQPSEGRTEAAGSGRTEPSAIALSTHAIDFAEAASALLDAGSGDAHLMVVHSLYGHAIELAIKAFLRHRGVLPKELRNSLGHDLSKCVDQALMLDPTDPFNLAADRALIDHLSETYGRKGFEYRNVATFRIAELGSLRDLTERLAGQIREYLRAEMRHGRVDV